MKLLENVSRGVLENGIPIDTDSRSLLVEASLELIHFTPRPGKTLDQADKCLKAYRKVGFSEFFSKEQLAHFSSDKFSLWMRWLTNSFRCFQDAILRVQSKSHVDASKTLKTTYETIRRMVDMTIFSGKDAKTYDELIGAISQNSSLFVEKYLQFGIIPPTALSYAVAAELIRQRKVPNGVKGGEILSRIAFEFWDKADDKARCARQSDRLADILSAAHECHLLYNIAKVLLQWGIARYEEARVSIPTELQKEHQVVEELRVAMAETLRDCGGNFVFQSIFHTFWNSENTPLKQALASGIDDAIAKNPLYPNLLAESWREFSEQFCKLPNNSKVVVSRYDWTLESEIRKEMFERFQRCFSDKSVATVAQRIFDRWLTTVAK